MATKCNEQEQVCTSISGPNFPDKSQGNNQTPCVTKPGALRPCPPTKDPTCSPFQLSQNRDSCVIDSITNEALNIGGAVLNVYKLLGVHEQCKLVDSTGNGAAISSGNTPGYPSSNAFDKYITEWRSLQRGPGVTTSSFIGYDFGEIKTADKSRRMYGVETSVRKHITAFAIKQGSNEKNRVTRVRLEYSEDAKNWYGAGLATLPNDDCFNTVLMKHSAPARYWRLRPLDFKGGEKDYWAVQALQMFHNFVATEQYNIQDKVLMENRDRDYSTEPITLKGHYDLVDAQSELKKFGIELPSLTLYMTINFSSCVSLLGRPIVIGDIIEVPSEAQYTSEMKRVLKWMEVTDVTWSTSGYTPGWQPTLLKVTTQPAFVSQETQDLFGDLAENYIENGLGLLDKGDGMHPLFQDLSSITRTIAAEAKDAVPQQGREGSSHIREFEPEELLAAEEQGLPMETLNKIGLNPNELYVEDGMPPNNAPFTEGDEFPDVPTHGDYHRLTYSQLSSDVPPRLYRYSGSKGRWIFLETDRREQYNSDKPLLSEFLRSENKKPRQSITQTPIDFCEKE